MVSFCFVFHVSRDADARDADARDADARDADARDAVMANPYQPSLAFFKYLSLLLYAKTGLCFRTVLFYSPLFQPTPVWATTTADYNVIK